MFVQVNADEFNKFVKDHDLIPNGFNIVGSMQQTNWYDSLKRERARMSIDGFGTIYEVDNGKDE